MNVTLTWCVCSTERRFVANISAKDSRYAKKGKESVRRGRKVSLYRLNLYRVAQILSVKAYNHCIVEVLTITSDIISNWRNIK